MPKATMYGKKHALAELVKRLADNQGKDWLAITQQLPARSPMFFGCLSCNAAISVPENYLSRPSLCSDCQALKELDWLE